MKLKIAIWNRWLDAVCGPSVKQVKPLTGIEKQALEVPDIEEEYQAVFGAKK